AFLSRTVDRTLQRGNRRAAMDQFWTPQVTQSLAVTTLASGAGPRMLRFDGDDVWVANQAAGTVSRIHGSDGKLLQTWTGAADASGIVVAMGRIFVSVAGFPSKLYQIAPTQPPGAATTVASNLGYTHGIAFDGIRIWTSNLLPPAGVSIVTPGPAIPW